MSGHTHTYTHYTHDNYSNPRCAHARQGLITKLAGSSVNSRPSHYFITGVINPLPLSGTGFYSEEAFI